jgi:hypothetical protein
MQVFRFGERIITKSAVDLDILHLTVQILDGINIAYILGSHWWTLFFIGE